MLKTKQVTISEVVGAELEKIPKWKLLMHLQENGESSAYAVSKELNWLPSKVHAVIRRLEKSKAVKSRIVIINGRAVKFVSLVK